MCAASVTASERCAAATARSNTSTFATLNGAGLSAKPPYPNTARLFIDFLLSKPAQQRLRALRRIPARSDVEPLSPKMDQSRLKLAIALRDSVEEYNTSIKEFREIFGR
jgi:ABC-type Fe3+ transport system substrate-binding protein